MLRIVVDGELTIHFLGLPLLVNGHGRRANVTGYMAVIRDIFMDYPDLEPICIAVATYATNVMFS